MRGAWWAWMWPMARARRAKAGSMRIRAKMSLLNKVLIDPAPALTRDEGGVGVDDGGIDMGGVWVWGWMHPYAPPA